MSRFGALLLLLLAVPGYAETGPAAGFNAQLATAVYSTALAFMEPRTLDPVPVSQLTIWGLHGLSALDPDLTVDVREGNVWVSLPNGPLLSAKVPQTEDPSAWAAVAAQLSSAAWANSTKLRRAGTTGVITNFFDEIFNHLDPYSRYVPPSEAGEDRARRTGSAGIGLTLAPGAKASVVQLVVSDGPAATAGIRPGDTILAVNGQSTRGVDAATVAGWIGGPEDTDVSVTVRGHDFHVRTIDMVRAVVPPDTVFAERQRDVLMIRVTEFDQATSARLTRVLRATLDSPAAAAQPLNGIILDLRGNRGGLVREAIGVAEGLLQPGVIASAVGRDPDATRVWRSSNGDLADDLPVVVMVDGRTASAAEILAAALADRDRAVVVGSATLGKGLVQTIAPLPDGGELFVTWARVLAPRGWPLQGLGVLPQVCTSLGQTTLQNQLNNLDDGAQPMAAAIIRHRDARPPLAPAQALAIRASCPAAEGSDADLLAAQFLIQHPIAYVSALLPPMHHAEPPTLGAP